MNANAKKTSESTRSSKLVLQVERLKLLAVHSGVHTGVAKPASLTTITLWCASK